MARPEGVDPLRVAAYRRGLFGETLAAWAYRLRFYRVLARRYRTPLGEIDLIVRRGRMIVFVEVKHRPSEAEALETMVPRARRRIAQAAELWLAAHPDAAGLDLRFDLVIVNPRRLPRRVTAAFGAGGGS
jgi:putative endonuclease